MSYQFEDESALEELLNQQLDRRKQQLAQARPGSSRPGTSMGVARNNSSQFRPSTASNIIASNPNRQDATQIVDPTPSNDLSKNKLSAWLEGGGVSSARKPSMPSTDNYGQYSTGPISSQPFVEPINSRATIDSSQMDKGDELTNLENLLTSGSLQEMSKQRLIQLILERIVPRLSNNAQVASKQSTIELDRLARELQAERARSQILELRHEEQLKLEQQKASQLCKQLETRLELVERELIKTMDGQREHLNKLEEQYKISLSGLNENYAQRMGEEKLRFEQMLRARDEMHKLEIDSKLNVNCNLTKLDTIQSEWKQTLTGTIEQLEGHFKLVESLLERQTFQVKGTNSELAAKTKQLCDQHDKLNALTGQLARVASQMDELLPELASSHGRIEKQHETTGATLVVLDNKLSLLSAREVQLDKLRAGLEGDRVKLDEEKLQLALDTARVQMKEERLDETLRSAEERERALVSERTTLMEQTSQAQIKRVSLDERAADLKEQNYTLHLLRKRLTHQREELIRAQVSYANERKSLKGERAQVGAESNRLTAIRVRAQRELDQLRRLQRALVCSLCMGRLFNATGRVDGNVMANYEQQLELLPLDLDNNNNNNNNNGQDDDDDDDDDGDCDGDDKKSAHDAGQLLGRQLHGLAGPIAKGNNVGQKPTATRPTDERYFSQPRDNQQMPDDGDDLARELRLTELECGQLAAETRYVEQLLENNG